VLAHLLDVILGSRGAGGGPVGALRGRAHRGGRGCTRALGWGGLGAACGAPRGRGRACGWGEACAPVSDFQRENIFPVIGVWISPSRSPSSAVRVPVPGLWAEAEGAGASLAFEMRFPNMSRSSRTDLLEGSTGDAGSSLAPVCRVPCPGRLVAVPSGRGPCKCCVLALRHRGSALRSGDQSAEGRAPKQCAG